jgi:hypothetical protein
VLAAGGTAANNFPNDERNAEVFYPPYLFGGPRPAILSAPVSIAYGQEFGVLTPAPADIADVVLMRPGMVTHSFNQEQRHVRLTFKLSALPEGLTVTAPAGPTLAPPGYYMLFLIGQGGVPSVARFIHVS